MARAAVKIDISSIPSKFLISKAVFRLYKYGHFTTKDFSFDKPAPYYIHRVTKKWEENSANWEKATNSEKWTKQGGDFSSTVIDSFKYDGKLNKAWFTWDVTAEIKDMIKNPDKNLGFMILVKDKYPNQEISMDQESYFHSSEASDKKLIPRLIVTGTISTATRDKTVSNTLRQLQIQNSHNVISVFIENQAAYSISVADYMGRTLFEHSGVGKSDWEYMPHNFAPGMYYIKLQSGNLSQVQKAMMY